MTEFDDQIPAGWRFSADRGRRADRTGERNPLDSRASRELDQIAGTLPPKRRSLPLHVLVRLLVDAGERNSAWLEDFAEDSVTIDADLHDVLLAYQKVRRAA